MNSEDVDAIKRLWLAAWLLVGTAVIAGMFTNSGFKVIPALILASFITIGSVSLFKLTLFLKRKFYDNAATHQRLVAGVSLFWIISSISYVLLFSDEVSDYNGYSDDEILYMLKVALFPPVVLVSLYATVKNALRK